MPETGSLKPTGTSVLIGPRWNDGLAWRVLSTPDGLVVERWDEEIGSWVEDASGVEMPDVARWPGLPERASLLGIPDD